LLFKGSDNSFSIGFFFTIIARMLGNNTLFNKKRPQKTAV